MAAHTDTLRSYHQHKNSIQPSWKNPHPEHYSTITCRFSSCAPQQSSHSMYALNALMTRTSRSSSIDFGRSNVGQPRCSQLVLDFARYILQDHQSSHHASHELTLLALLVQIYPALYTFQLAIQGLITLRNFQGKIQTSGDATT